MLASYSCLDYSNGSKDVMVILVTMSKGNTGIVDRMLKALTVLGFLHNECMPLLLEGLLFVSVLILHIHNICVVSGVKAFRFFSC